MECPVCFSDKPLVKLSCGHSFCKTCVKEWHAKAPTCPMCRRTMLFKGVTRLNTESQQKRVDSMYDDVISAAYDSVCEQAVIPEFIPYAMHSVEKTFRALRMIHVDPDIIEAIIYDTDEIWSERNTYARVRRFYYNKERLKYGVPESRKRTSHGYSWKRW